MVRVVAPQVVEYNWYFVRLEVYSQLLCAAPRYLPVMWQWSFTASLKFLLKFFRTNRFPVLLRSIGHFCLLIFSFRFGGPTNLVPIASLMISMVLLRLLSNCYMSISCVRVFPRHLNRLWCGQHYLLFSPLPACHLKTFPLFSPVNL